MNTDTIYSVTKGSERVSLADKKSAIELMNALAILDCTETFSMRSLTGNKQDLDVYETGFFGKHINVITLPDAERVLHWMMAFGCTKVSVEKLINDSELHEKEEKNVISHQD